MENVNLHITLTDQMVNWKHHLKEDFEYYLEAKLVDDYPECSIEVVSEPECANAVATYCDDADCDQDDIDSLIDLEEEIISEIEDHFEAFQVERAIASTLED